jgi:hypothetical protein
MIRTTQISPLVDITPMPEMSGLGCKAGGIEAFPELLKLSRNEQFVEEQAIEDRM